MNIDIAIRIMKEKVKNEYALKYISNIPNAIEQDGMKGLYTQMCYIVDNISTWRGKEAIEVKKFIREWIAEKGKTINAA